MTTVRMPERARESKLYLHDGIEKTFSEIRKDLAGRTAMLFTDENVFRLYGVQIKKYFGEMSNFVMCAGEANKNEKTLFALLQKMSNAKLLKTSVLICLGGGVVGDLGGLAASLYMRGIKYVHVPTTLLAQADACLGGKTAIDFNGVKNLIGAFYPPEKIYIDTEFLKTLPEREIRCGLGEIVKHGALCPEIFELLMENLENLTQVAFLKDMVPMSIAFKASVVEKDPYEANLRKILNLGHTTAHAIELNHDLSHGESVLCGMLLESYFVDGDAEFLAQLRTLCVKALGGFPKLNLDEKTLQAALFDKKNANEGKVWLTLVTAAGKYEFAELPFADYVAGILRAEEICSNLL